MTACRVRTPSAAPMQRHAPRPSLNGLKPAPPSASESVKNVWPPLVKDIRLRLTNVSLSPVALFDVRKVPTAARQSDSGKALSCAVALSRSAGTAIEAARMAPARRGR